MATPDRDVLETPLNLPSISRGEPIIGTDTI